MPERSREPAVTERRPSIPPALLARLLPQAIGLRLILLIVSALVPLLLVLGWAYRDSYQSRFEEVLQTELGVARGVAATFRAFVDDVRRSNHLAGEAILTFEQYSGAKATRVLKQAAEQYRTVHTRLWLTPDGTVRASSLTGLVGENLSSRDFFQAIVKGASWAIGNLMETGIVTRVPLFSIATAIRDEHTGTLRGVVVAGVTTGELGPLLMAQRRPGGPEIVLFDRQGVLVYQNPVVPLTWEARTRWRDSDTLLRLTLEAGYAHTGVGQLPLVEQPSLIARVPISGLGWVAGAGQLREAALAPIRRELRRDAGIALLVSALALLLAYVLARSIAAPLHRLERETAVLGAGGAAARADPVAPAEVQRVRHAVERMATELSGREQALRKAVEALDKRTRELDAVLSSVQDYVYIFDPGGPLRLCQSRNCSISGGCLRNRLSARPCGS